MTGYKKSIGAWGEDIACQFLVGRGVTVIARNVRTPYGEIDLIGRQGETTLFVEVKTLTSRQEFLPEDNITARKREHMIACAEYYAADQKIDHWQIDVISIEGKPGSTPIVTHFENAI
jgi:putative endonuclease